MSFQKQALIKARRLKANTLKLAFENNPDVQLIKNILKVSKFTWRPLAQQFHLNIELSP